MSPILKKVFMLERHQLIRWGTVSGYGCVIFSLLLVGTSIILLAVLNSELRTSDANLKNNSKIEHQIIESRKSLDELITVAIKTSEYHKKRHSPCSSGFM